MNTKQLLFLSADDINNVITMKDTIELMREAFRQISEKKITSPLRIHIDIPKHYAGALFMPAYSEESDFISLKLVTLFKNNPSINLPLIHALVVLMNGTTGEPLAVMDGENLTALRTGAASGLATDLLANPEASVLGIFGAGVQGRAQIKAVCEVRDISRVIIFDNNPETAKNLADNIEAKYRVEINPSKYYISECDIICTATSSPEPLFADSDLKDGVHINAVGAYQPDKREIPGETIKRSKCIVDQRSACLEEAGDIIIPIQQGLIHDEHIYSELGEIVIEKKLGRTDESEITLFKSVGNAAQDLLTAGDIYKRAQKSGIGTYVSL